MGMPIHTIYSVCSCSGIDDPSIASPPVEFLLRGKLLSDIKGPLSMLKSIERWAGRYPLSAT